MLVFEGEPRMWSQPQPFIRCPALRYDDAMGEQLRNRDYFQSISRMQDADIPLFDAALMVCQEEFPEVSIGEVRAEIAEIASRVEPLLEGEVAARCAGLAKALFGELGFSGNRDDYYDPLNSYVSSVLSRRKGIPLTLALIMIECGRALDLPLVGVGFPGHYLVRHETDDSVLLDPFSGVPVDREKLARRLDEPGLDGETIKPLLKRAGNRKSLLRLISNLKHAYMLKNEFSKALRTCEIALLLNPNHAASYRDRGLVCEKLEMFHRAEKDLTTYLELSPNDSYATAVAEHLVALKNRVAMFH